MPQSATPIRCACCGQRSVVQFQSLDFYSTRRPTRLSVILPCFRPKEIWFFRESIMPGGQSLFGRYRFLKTAFFFFDQNFALSGVIGLPNNALEFHALHQRSGAIIPDLQPALDVTGGSLAVALDDRYRLRKQVAATLATHARGIEHRAVFVGRLFCGDRLEIFGLALRLEMAHHLLNLFVRYEGSMYPADTSATRHVEHVALSEQLLGAHLAEDGAAVDLG